MVDPSSLVATESCTADIVAFGAGCMAASEHLVRVLLSFNGMAQGPGLQTGPCSSPHRLLDTGGGFGASLAFMQPLPHSNASLSLSPTVHHQKSDLTEKSDLHKCGLRCRISFETCLCFICRLWHADHLLLAGLLCIVAASGVLKSLSNRQSS